MQMGSPAPPPENEKTVPGGVTVIVPMYASVVERPTSMPVTVDVVVEVLEDVDVVLLVDVEVEVVEVEVVDDVLVDVVDDVDVLDVEVDVVVVDEVDVVEVEVVVVVVDCIQISTHCANPVPHPARPFDDTHAIANGHPASLEQPFITTGPTAPTQICDSEPQCTSLQPVGFCGDCTVALSAPTQLPENRNPVCPPRHGLLESHCALQTSPLLAQFASVVVVEVDVEVDVLVVDVVEVEVLVVLDVLVVVVVDCANAVEVSSMRSRKIRIRWCSWLRKWTSWLRWM